MIKLAPDDNISYHMIHFIPDDNILSQIITLAPDDNNVIIWDYTLSSGMNRYHVELMLSSGANVIIWDKMLSFGANVKIVSSGGHVIIWCYHVMLSAGMITYPFFIFPENFTHSIKKGRMGLCTNDEDCPVIGKLF
jgi:hypothetical protein